MADEGGAPGPSNREGNEQAKALDKMTDLAEEREIKKVDQSKIGVAMAELAQQQREQHEAAWQRERALAAVKIQAADVNLIVAEFEIDKKVAERRLREANGDVKAALKALVDEP